MPGFVERRWEGDPSMAGGRRARANLVYRAFMPDPIATLDPPLRSETWAAIADAEEEVAALNGEGSLLGLETVGPLLLRSEAIASSRIEKLLISQQNLARALLDPSAARGTARAVAANVLAMERAIAIGDRAGPLGVDDLAEVHRVLLEDEDPRNAGVVRTEQNWIGGRLASPADAVYVPPPEDEVPRLLADLIRFAERADLPALTVAAIAHAQFETIHPFVDGNGRTGRCLIHLILRRRGLAPHFVPPVSVVLAARPHAYVAGLVAFREGDVAAWVGSFAEAMARAARLSQELARAVATLVDDWRERAGRPRRDGAPARLLRLLPAQPILSAATARIALGTSHEAARLGLLALAEAGIVRQISGGTYDRTYAADELFELIADYERKIAGSPRHGLG